MGNFHFWGVFPLYIILVWWESQLLMLCFNISLLFFYLAIFFLILKCNLGEFLGSPGVGIPCFHCRGPGFNPCSGNWNPTRCVAWPPKKKKRKKKKEIWVYFRLLIQLLAIFKVSKIYLNVYYLINCLSIKGMRPLELFSPRLCLSEAFSDAGKGIQGLGSLWVLFVQPNEYIQMMFQDFFSIQDMPLGYPWRFLWHS